LPEPEPLPELDSLPDSEFDPELPEPEPDPVLVPASPESEPLLELEPERYPGKATVDVPKTTAGVPETSVSPYTCVPNVTETGPPAGFEASPPDAP